MPGGTLIYRIDQLEEIVADFRHRALLHHGKGIFTAEMVFGTTLTTSTGRQVAGAAD